LVQLGPARGLALDAVRKWRSLVALVALGVGASAASAAGQVDIARRANRRQENARLPVHYFKTIHRLSTPTAGDPC
jgi:hypothetical protein